MRPSTSQGNGEQGNGETRQLKLRGLRANLIAMVFEPRRDASASAVGALGRRLSGWRGPLGGPTLLAVCWLAFTASPACDRGRVITLGYSAGGTPDAASGGSGTAKAGYGGQGGDGAPPLIELSVQNARKIEELSNEEKDDNPTLTADELDICITSKRTGGQGGSDIWCASRVSTDLPFDPLQPVGALNQSGFDSSAALSLDGLVLWFGTKKDDGLGGLDIFASERSDRSAPWGEPTRVVELSSEADDIPRPVAVAGAVMPLGSRRAGDGYQTFLATRPATDAPFFEPKPISELTFAGVEIVDGFLTEDNLLLLYSLVDAASDELSDVYYSYRTTPDEPFSAPYRMRGEVNTKHDDRDPWLSSDGKRLYFSSNRGGDFEIYMADVVRTDH